MYEKAVTCDDEPTEKYITTLQIPSALKNNLSSPSLLLFLCIFRNSRQAAVFRVRSSADPLYATGPAQQS